MKKRLMVIESCMKIHMEWLGRKSLATGVVLFRKSWKEMFVFAESEPVVPITCNFIQELRLKVLSGDVHENPGEFVQSLRTDATLLL